MPRQGLPVCRNNRRNVKCPVGATLKPIKLPQRIFKVLQLIFLTLNPHRKLYHIIKYTYFDEFFGSQFYVTRIASTDIAQGA